MRILDTRQMREADRRTIEDVGIPSAVLMENAGRQVVGAMESVFEDLDTLRIAILCGTGNNGGDGFVIARTLVERGVDLAVYLIGEASAVKGDARANLTALRNLGVDLVEVADAGAWELHGSDVLDADLIVDALFGTGLRGALTGLAQTVVEDVNASPVPVVAVDLPSGLSADTAAVPGPSIEATLTVTMAAPKLPLVMPPAERQVGALIIADVGIPDAVIDSIDGPRVEVLTRDDLQPLIAPRTADSHKGDYGRVLLVAGSRGKVGAAGLATRAALRSGAGLVTTATPAGLVATLAVMSTESMTLPLPEDAQGLATAEALESVLAFKADVIGIGPGLGCSAGTAALVAGLLSEAGVPLVLDADALNVCATHPELLVGRDDVPIVITPHPGEMARLIGRPVEDVQANRIAVARDFAVEHRVHVVLKGHRTVVASPDGRVGVNLTGNPGMATGGSGDVLLGMLTAWLAQLLDPEAAARLAVYLHGLAGDLAAAREGEVAMLAGDIVDQLGAAVRDLGGRGSVSARGDEAGHGGE